MRRWPFLFPALILTAGCGLLPVGEGGIGWPMPGSETGGPATAALPTWGVVDQDLLLYERKAEGTIVDPYGEAMAGVILCVGTGEADAVPMGATDSLGAYSVSLEREGTEESRLLLWPFLPLTRFEPEGYAFEGVVFGGEGYDFKGLPAIYPVPPERDCR